MNRAPLTTNTPETAELPKETREPQARIRPAVIPLSFWANWSWWLPPALVSIALSLYFVDPFIGDWDAFDYTILSLTGYPSSMALGRNLFIFSNHVLYEAAHTLFRVAPENAYLIFKYAVLVQAPLAVISCWILARDVTASIYSATVASLFLVFSPVFVLYAGQVMTDVPSVLLMTTALIIHLRGITQQRAVLIMFGAAFLGLGVNLRETVAFYAPWLLVAPFLLGWKLRRREIGLVALSFVIFLVLGFGWFAYWFLTDSYYRNVWFGWRESMGQESSRHPVSINNVIPFLMYFFITAPLVLVTFPFAVLNEWRRRKLSPLLALALMGLIADLMLFFNYSTTVNWRYFLTGLPALVPLSADYLLRGLTRRLGTVRLAFLSCLAALLALAVTFAILTKPISERFINRRAMSKNYRNQLMKVPRDAVMISGGQTIAVNYWKAIGAGRWETIGTGSGWPGDNLTLTIENYLNKGRRVFIDADPRLWLPCSWQRAEIPAIVDLEKRFRFRRVSETIFEIRPLSDNSAADIPGLHKLLPENRPEDTIKCLPWRT